MQLDILHTAVHFTLWGHGYSMDSILSSPMFKCMQVMRVALWRTWLEASPTYYRYCAIKETLQQMGLLARTVGTERPPQLTGLLVLAVP